MASQFQTITALLAKARALPVTTNNGRAGRAKRRYDQCLAIAADCGLPESFGRVAYDHYPKSLYRAIRLLAFYAYAQHDGRYTVSLEYCGYAKPQYVARWCDDWLGFAPDKGGAWNIAQAHKAARVRDL